MVVVIFGSTLRVSGKIPPCTTCCLSFHFSVAYSISAKDGGLKLTFSRLPSVGAVLGISVEGGLFRMSWKCSTHLALCSGSIVMAMPSLLLTSFDGLPRLPDIYPDYVSLSCCTVCFHDMARECVCVHAVHLHVRSKSTALLF